MLFDGTGAFLHGLAASGIVMHQWHRSAMLILLVAARSHFECAVLTLSVSAHVLAGVNFIRVKLAPWHHKNKPKKYLSSRPQQLRMYIPYVYSVCEFLYFCMYIRYVHSVCTFCVRILYVYSLCIFCMYIVYVYSVYILYAYYVCIFGMYILCVHSVFIFVTYILYVYSVYILYVYFVCEFAGEPNSSTGEPTPSKLNLGTVGHGRACGGHAGHVRHARAP